MLSTFGLSPVAHEFCGMSFKSQSGSVARPVDPESPSTTIELG
jgi:hypothetical protein